MKLSNDATFTVSSTNPRREGGVQFDRFAALQKFRKGTTVAQVAEVEGLRLALQYAVAQGHAKVVGGTARAAAAPAKAAPAKAAPTKKSPRKAKKAK